MTDPSAIGRDLLALAAACEATNTRWSLFRSWATSDGTAGEFYICILYEKEKGGTHPFTSTDIASVVEAAAKFSSTQKGT